MERVHVEREQCVITTPDTKGGGGPPNTPMSLLNGATWFHFASKQTESGSGAQIQALANQSLMSRLGNDALMHLFLPPASPFVQRGTGSSERQRVFFTKSLKQRRQDA